MNRQLTVTWIARFFYRSGDLHGAADARARPEEGIRMQRALQLRRHADPDTADTGPQPAWRDGYRPEYPLMTTLSVAGETFTIAGRIDGVALGDNETLIEEYKTTRAPGMEAHARHEQEHWAQIRLYAGLLAATEGRSAHYRLRLTYVHPDHASADQPSLGDEGTLPGVVDLEERMAADDARALYQDAVERVRAWFEREIAHRAARDRAIGTLAFPYAGFRPHQRALAGRCYRALIAREPLLLEAPTGTGKTAAILFPGVRALAGDGLNRIVFLTSRTTGARAAHEALGRINGERPWLRTVHLQARERVCEINGTPCDPRGCPRTQGYYDRVKPALRNVLDRVAITADVLGEVAEAHDVCPHELALDAAAWSDVIVCDYNYVFDPGARLQRAAPDAETIVLIDEAHQLVPRVRDMLARIIDTDQVRAALNESPPEPIARRVRGVVRQLQTLARDASPGEQRVAPPAALIRAVGRLADEATNLGLAMEPWPETRGLVFEALRWSALQTEPDPRWCWRVTRASGAAMSLSVRQDCLDPGPEIRAALDQAGAHVRYSGTVSPLGLYQRLQGFPGAPADRGGSLFRPEQLAVLHVPDIATYLRARAGSLARLVALVASVASTRIGRFLVAFPSFDYLDMFDTAFRVAHPQRPVETQAPRMNDTARAAFLERLTAPLGHQSRLGFVVLGGIFGESVDFADAELAGVICVGPGLAPPSLLADDIASYWSALGEDGPTIAYLQPALVKTVQMAGRLLRGPTSRGVLLLVDPRFDRPAYTSFFPGHWRLERVPAARVAARVANFWQESSAAPRLPATLEEPPT